MRSARRHLELAAIIGVTTLAAWLRFTDLETNPAWNIGQSLLIFSRLPLFENLLAVSAEHHRAMRLAVARRV